MWFIITSLFIYWSVHQNTELVFKRKNFKTGDGFPCDSSLCSALGNKYADDYLDVTKRNTEQKGILSKELWMIVKPAVS